MAVNTNGDISPRTAQFAIAKLLDRGIPYLVFENFGQTFQIPSNKSKVAMFRRYEALDTTPNALVEGVTPSGKSLTKTDITATLIQLGDGVTISDVVQDTHEDNVLSEAIDLLGEQAAQMVEKMRFGVLRAGSNVFYSAGAARSSVNAVISTTLQNKVTRALKRQNARPISKKVNPSPDYATAPIAPSFFAVCHPDLEPDIRAMTGFTPAELYAQSSPYDNEIGKVNDCRYLLSTIVEPWPDAGGAKGSTLSTSGTSSDVYPVLYFAQNAYGIVSLKGQNSITPMVVNPKPSDSDPWGQRGWATWKTLTTCAILNDFWCARLEVAVTA